MCRYIVTFLGRALHRHFYVSTCVQLRVCVIEMERVGPLHLTINDMPPDQGINLGARGTPNTIRNFQVVHI